MSAPDFWNDNEAAQQVINEVNGIKAVVEKFQDVSNQFDDLQVMQELLEEEPDEDIQSDLFDGVKQLKEKLEAFELELLLNEPYDKNNAILELHSGAGGTESQDWTSMLLRMYQRWAEDRGFKIQMLSYLAGDTAGVKSVTLLITGYNAYGYLKAEKGVHRLVRISPFDSSGRRHTSFASCDVVPEIENDDSQIEVRSEDITVDTYRATGAGGQHVNTTDSAVRITHHPTGIIVTCQNERSQIKNREQAMKVLRSKLYERKIEEQRKELEDIRGDQQEIGWGSQIRSYVFHPYSMVKDHRTNVETGHIDSVMNGHIDPFIDAYLRNHI